MFFCKICLSLFCGFQMQLPMGFMLLLVLIFGFQINVSNANEDSESRVDMDSEDEEYDDKFQIEDVYDEYDVEYDPNRSNFEPEVTPTPKVKEDSKKKSRNRRQRKRDRKRGGKKNKNEPEIFIAGDEETKKDDIIISLARQLMLLQLGIEERVRSEGGSGIKQVRVNSGGTRPYHSAHHSSSSVAAIHNHANNIRTVGMGEFIGVLNGVEFRTRHNDFRLKQPHQTDSSYHATEDIEFPDVPEEVLKLTTVDEQVEEMRMWFKAFKDRHL